LYFEEGCEGDCEQIGATVCNGAGDMAGPTMWELYWVAAGNPKDGVSLIYGPIEPLRTDQCRERVYNPNDNPNGPSGNYMFKVHQRPGHPGSGEAWSEPCELERPAAPSISLEKYVSNDGENWYDADDPIGPEILVGRDVWFKFVVVNDGNVPLTGVTLRDTDFDLGSYPMPDELAPGESFEHKIEPFAAEEGQHTSTAIATGDYDGETYSDEDDANYFGAAPCIDVEKYVSDDGQNWRDADSPTGPEILMGKDVWFRFVVTNTGNVSLTDITLSDTDFDLSSCMSTAVLSPGDAPFECVIGPFVAEKDQHTDTATAIGAYGGEIYSDTDDANYFGTEERWDRSSLYFAAGCEGGCDQVNATVCNGQDAGDMAGPTSWELYWAGCGNPREGVRITSGAVEPLRAGMCQTLTYELGDNSYGTSGNYIFVAYQRPGHPGSGELWSESCELDCTLSECYPYAHSIWSAVVVTEPLHALCMPDGSRFAVVGTAEDSVLILDMGHLPDQEGDDLVYYEFWGSDKGPGSIPGILMDPVQIDVAQATDTCEPDPITWQTVLIWGDDNSSNNGNIPLDYARDGESANDPIPAIYLYAGSDLDGNGVVDAMDGSGVAINIGGEDGRVWRFVRIRRFPLGMAAPSTESAEVDAVEAIHNR